MARRREICIEHEGQPMSLREFAECVRISHSTLQHRWRRGDRGERLVRPPDRKYTPGAFSVKHSGS